MGTNALVEVVQAVEREMLVMRERERRSLVLGAV